MSVPKCKADSQCFTLINSLNHSGESALLSAPVNPSRRGTEMLSNLAKVTQLVKQQSQRLSSGHVFCGWVLTSSSVTVRFIYEWWRGR